jgi:hypothetical protein
MTTAQLLGEVSLRCGDPEFKDFEKQIYQRAIYRSNREIAKFYGILQKTFSFTLQDQIEAIDGDIILDLPDMKAEFLVSVNGNELVKVANKLETQMRYCYYLEFREGTWYFNYTLGDNGLISGIDITGQDITETMSQSLFERIESSDVQQTIKAFSDQITICYTIIPDLESDIGEYDIPSKFEEEQLERTINYMSKLGLAKFPNIENSEKGQKYYRLYQMYKNEKRSDIDANIAKDREFIKITPWSVI